jgi:hypothetical protein
LAKTFAGQSLQEAKRGFIMGKVRCIKPKADAGSMGKAAKKAATGFWRNSFITIIPQE